MGSKVDLMKLSVLVCFVLTTVTTSASGDCKEHPTGTIFKKLNRAYLSSLEIKVDDADLDTTLDFYTKNEDTQFWVVLRFYDCADDQLYFTLRSCYESCHSSCYHYLARNGTDELGLEPESADGYPVVLSDRFDPKLFFYDPTVSPFTDYLPLQQRVSDHYSVYVNNNGSNMTVDSMMNIWAFVPVGAYGGNSITNLLTVGGEDDYEDRRRKRSTTGANHVVYWYKVGQDFHLGLAETTAGSSTSTPPVEQRLEALLFIIYPLLNISDTAGSQAYANHYKAVVFRLPGSDQYIDGGSVNVRSGLMDMDWTYKYTPPGSTSTTDVVYHAMDFKEHTAITLVSTGSKNILDQKHVDTRFFRILPYCEGSSTTCSTLLQSIVQPGHYLAVVHTGSGRHLVLTPYRTDLSDDVLQFGFDFVLPLVTTQMNYPTP